MAKKISAVVETTIKNLSRGFNVGDKFIIVSTNDTNAIGNEITDEKGKVSTYPASIKVLRLATMTPYLINSGSLSAGCLELVDFGTYGKALSPMSLAGADNKTLDTSVGTAFEIVAVGRGIPTFSKLKSVWSLFAVKTISAEGFVTGKKEWSYSGKSLSFTDAHNRFADLAKESADYFGVDCKVQPM